MSWIQVVFSSVVTACLTLAAVHLMVWFEVRKASANLFLSLGAAMALASMAYFELSMMHAQTAEEYATAVRWLHLPVWALLLIVAGFVHFHLRAGRAWLFWSVCGLRTVSLALNFLFDQNLNYLEITGLEQVQFLGEPVSVAVGVLNPMMIVGVLSVFLLVVFIVDAALTLWRRGERQHALIFGSCILVFLLLPMIEVLLALLDLIHWPPAVSLFAAPLVAAMSYEMSRDVVRSEWLARQLELSQHDLSRSEQRLKLAADGARLAVWEWNVPRDELWVSDRGRALFGFSPDESLDFSKLLGRVHPDERALVQAAVAKSRREGGRYEREYRIVCPDGRVRWIATLGQVDSHDGAMGEMMRGVSFDITRRKQAEERFQRVVEAAPCGIVMTDPNGVIAYANPRAEGYFDYSSGALVGCPLGILLPGQGLEQPMGNDMRQSGIPESAAIDVEALGRRKDGGEIPLQIGFSAMPGPDGDLLLMMMVDVSERRERELEIERQRNELAHLSRVTMLSELSGSLAHELNQPLAAILSNAQAALRFLARDAPDLDELGEILRDIVEDDRRAGGVIQGLRMLLKRGETRQEPLDTNAEVGAVLKLVRGDLINAEVSALTMLAPNLPPVWGDRVQLQQVLLNLVVNGCEAMAHADAVNRQLVVKTELAADGVVQVSIADQGRGIATEHMEHIFEPFYTTRSDGLGLGLAVCRRLVEANGGHLWAINGPGGGACFCFTLPVSEGGSS